VGTCSRLLLAVFRLLFFTFLESLESPLLRRKKQQDIIKSLPEEKAAELLNALQPDDRTAFLSELSGNAVKELLKVLTPEHRAKTLELLGYAEGSVGRLMTPDYVSIKTSETCQDVLNIIRQRGKATENLNFLFVIDDHGVLIDDINIKDFLVVDPGTTVAQIMDYQFIALKVNDAQSSAVKVFRNNSRFALPVIDDNGVLLGVVTLDDVLRLAESDSTREIQKIGGSEALDEPYTTISFVLMHCNYTSALTPHSKHRSPHTTTCTLFGT